MEPYQKPVLEVVAIDKDAITTSGSGCVGAEPGVIMTHPLP